MKTYTQQEISKALHKLNNDLDSLNEKKRDINRAIKKLKKI